jgi:uncharacterized membrane protein YcaP (DUF421 family)
MESVLRVVVMYVFLMLVFRLTGKRTLGEATTFDLLLLLVISETTQQAMVDDDHSMTHAFLLIITFLAINVGLSLLKVRSERFDKLLEGAPLLLVSDGRLLRERMTKARVGEDDIMEAARHVQGLERLDQIKYAVLERRGEISIIPKEPSG